MVSKKSSMFSQLIAGYLLVIATSGFARLAYGVLMPSMQEDLAINYAQAGFLATIISLGFLVISTLIAVLAQKFGIKKIVLAGGFLVTVCLFLLSFAKSYYFVMLIMFLLGAGSSLAFAPLMSLMVIQFANKKGLVLGILLSGVGSGMLLSGIITTNLSDYFPSLGWRDIWTIFGTISLIVTLLSLFVLKEAENKTNTKNNQNQSISKAFKNVKIIRIGIIYFLVGVGYLIPVLFQSSFMINSGFSEKIAGNVFALSGLSIIVGSPVFGMISDRIGRKNSLLITSILCMIAGILPVLNHHLIAFVAASILFPFSLGGFLVLIQSMAAERVSPSLVPAVLGYVSVFYSIGQLIGPSLAGAVIEKFGGIQSAYILASCIFLGTLIITSFVKENEKEEVLAVQTNPLSG